MDRQQVYPLRLGGVEFRPYRSPASGRIIDSPTKERDELARTNCFIDEPGVPQQIARRRKEIEAAGDARLGVLIEKTYGELEASGKAL
jgi:hypothetical protein